MPAGSSNRWLHALICPACLLPTSFQWKHEAYARLNMSFTQAFLYIWYHGWNVFRLRAQALVELASFILVIFRFRKKLVVTDISALPSPMGASSTPLPTPTAVLGFIVNRVSLAVPGIRKPHVQRASIRHVRV